MFKKLSTIIYHRVVSEKDFFYTFEPNISEFDKQVSLFSKYFNCLTISEAVAHLKHHTLPINALCITFDDGYEDFYSNAFPILQKYKVPATLYMTSNCLEGEHLWNECLRSLMMNPEFINYDLSDWGLGKYTLNTLLERVKVTLQLEQNIKYLNSKKRTKIISELLKRYPCKMPENTMLTESQLIKLSKRGIEIGSHTLSHPILTCALNDEARKEIMGSKEKLEAVLNKPVTSFAYPNGKPIIDYNEHHITFVKEAGYTSALSSSLDAQLSFDVFQLPRFSPAKHQGLGLFLRILKNKLF